MLSFSDYVFFVAYAQPPPPKGEALWSNSDELADVNGKIILSKLKVAN